MTMRERIARAIADDIGDGSVLWDLYLDTADAVLAAMAEPTDAMLRAGASSLDYLPIFMGRPSRSNRRRAAASFCAMLAAAGEPE